MTAFLCNNHASLAIFIEILTMLADLKTLGFADVIPIITEHR